MHQLLTQHPSDQHFLKGITSVVGNIFETMTGIFPQMFLASTLLPVLRHFKRKLRSFPQGREVRAEYEEKRALC